MPSRNRTKLYTPESYYHIYNRGVDRMPIFKDDRDYRHFLYLLKRYLSGQPGTDKYGRPYPDLSEHIDLLAYCLMPNHFHLLVYQRDKDAITDLMRRITGIYAQAFNFRHDREGPLFQDRYKAALITDEPYLWHISRYIHLNPGPLSFSYAYSSYKNYTGEHRASWLKPDKILNMHADSGSSYTEFVEDEADYRSSLADALDRMADF